MARVSKQKPGAGNQAGAPAAAGKSRKGLWIGLVLVMLVGGAAAAYFFLFADSDPAEQSADGAVTAELTRSPPIYYSLDPPFISNLAGTGGRRFMQITVQLMARNQAVIDAVLRHEPAVRNDLMMIFSAQTLESIDSPEGRAALRKESLEAVREILRRNEEVDALEDLLFTSFIVQ